MRAFLRVAHGNANYPVDSGEQPADSNAPSSVEQPAETFTSMKTLTRWLELQGQTGGPPDLQRVREAVLVLTMTPTPRQEKSCHFALHGRCVNIGDHWRR